MNDVHKVVMAELIALVVLTVLAALGITKPSTVQVRLIGAAPHMQATIYSADWCIPCKGYLKSIKSMAKDGWILKDAAEKDAASAHIVIDKRGASMESNKVEKLPCTVFRREGKEVKRIYGAMSPEDLARTFNEVGKETE